MRETVKNISGTLVGTANPQCRFERSVFILAHMRCGSTALSNILCSRPEISGYGEAHIAYRSTADLGRLVVNQALRHAWDPRARHLFDKLLHTRHDIAVPPEFFRARAIFLCRRPEPTIASIRRLFIGLGRDEYATDTAAAQYYVERLGRLAELWSFFPANRRLGLTHDQLTAQTDTWLQRMTILLGLEPRLENHYRSAAASIRGGGGDPTASATLSRIERRVPAADPAGLDISPALRQRAEDAYDRFVDTTGAGARARPDRAAVT
ncbi:hypothetical protein LA6_000032 [Marinibacterium anthonyi]|nr:hypothetical protein LA6_000032 [Marinibacterium anthonyi]